MGMTVAGLFAGIAGVEQGLEMSGFETELLCEIDPGAAAVLKRWLPDVPLEPDIKELKSLPSVDVVVAGFPCQDLSQAGHTNGISGKQSGLVEHVFELVRPARGAPKWLLLENVPFMLHLERGEAMRYLTRQLDELGYMWAYRVVDARAFGLPQRRLRVLLLASRTEDPRTVLFTDDAMPKPEGAPDEFACGFYWTEGNTGLGWAVNAIPTLKGGSNLGIASPPAVRLLADRSICTPSIEDAERIQGFSPGWTEASVTDAHTRPGHRWKLVGNAVSVPMATWIGEHLASPTDYDATLERPLESGHRWPNAAWGHAGRAYEVSVSTWPVQADYQDLETFIKSPKPLSFRATSGFFRRARASSLRFAEGFLDDVEQHLIRMQEETAVATAGR